MLEGWIEKYALDFKLMTEGVLETPIGIMIEVAPEEGEKLFNLDFELMVSSIDAEMAENTDAKYYVFRFGGSYYYTPIDSISNPELNPLKYIGNTRLKKFNWPFLGIHGRYELMSGSRDYSDWCKKANFYKTKTLGICEQSTLAGALVFQSACKDAGIKSIIGATYVVEKNNMQTYNIKLYVINDKGWRNILKVNKIVNVDNHQYKVIPEFDLVQLNKDGLFCVLDPIGEYSMGSTIDLIKRGFGDRAFMQFDPSKLLSNDRDREKLIRQEEYLGKYINIISPITISDAYYLDEDDAEIKEILNGLGNIKGQLTSHDQYFKHLVDIMDEMNNLFKEDDDRYYEIIKDGVNNCKTIDKECNFTIETGNRHLPKYEMSPRELKEHGTNKKMFLNLIEDGIEDSGILDKYTEEEVYDRVESEAKVILNAGVSDYFLITWDAIKFCEDNRILVGLGRGSAAGCLISFLLGIVKINPLDYNLLFERFLNPGRAMKSLPDIDTDFEGLRRDEVKRYMEDKYGHDYVASIGTFTTLQIRASIKDLNRSIGSTDTGTMNYVSQIFDGSSWGELFTESVKKAPLKKWILGNSDIVNKIPLCYNSPKSTSVHPCATIIVPRAKDDEGNEITIFDRIPMRLDDNGLLVTEWEGGELEDAGFLKQDLLSIKQLDKFRKIIDLVYESEGVDLDIYNLPLDDKEVLSYYGKGFNKDVFHFGSDSLSNYMRIVNPVSIEDLINSNALFRPGAMSSNAHMDYVKMKDGEKVPEYDYKLKEVTESTFGLYIFQEQVMQVCQIIGGFDMAEADDIRKAMGKKKASLLVPYKERFIDNAVNEGYSENDATNLWIKLESFASYGFNKSHAAAYAIIGYTCTWLKCHYPTQFWVTALQFARDVQVPGFVGEINKAGVIQIAPPDINNSDVTFVADYEEDKIFWSITKIKFVGEPSVEAILNERRKGGKFKSIEDFLERVDKKYTNKRAATNMILAGCFDIMYKIDSVVERGDIIEDLYFYRNVKEKDQAEWLNSSSANYEWFWILKQHEVSGLGDMSYKKAINFSEKFSNKVSMFVDPEEFFDESSYDKTVVIGGIVSEVSEKNTKKGMMGNITIDCNSELIKIRVWADQWEGKVGEGTTMSDELMKSKGRVLFISGKVAEPSMWNPDSILQSIGGKNKTIYEIL